MNNQPTIKFGLVAIGLFIVWLMHIYTFGKVVFLDTTSNQQRLLRYLSNTSYNGNINSNISASHGSSPSRSHDGAGDTIPRLLYDRAFLTPQEGNFQLVKKDGGSSGAIRKHNRPVEYGCPLPHNSVKRAPVVMVRYKLSSEVHNRFLAAPMFSSSQSELESFLLQKAIDYPKSKDTHTYYEGYFHSMPTSDALVSRNPRSGHEFQKPAAGDFIRGFYHSFRNLNSPFFTDLKEKLLVSANERVPNDPHHDICGLLAKWIDEGRLFGDLSVQLHVGSAIRDDELFWHSDAENSLLHLGLSIRGSRILHSKRAKTQMGEVDEVLEEQTAGDVYLSSSSLMNHAPEYPFSSWDDRIIAMQARILYTTTDLKLFRALKTDEAWEAMASVLAASLQNVQLNIPTISQIEDMMKSLG